jgi:predicted transcriptional regulator
MGDEPPEEDRSDLALSVRAAENRALSQETLEADYIYEALAHPRRRYVCYSLLEDAPQSLTELATTIAAWENEVSEREVTRRQRERVSVSLYHAHVPKLVDLGVVSFDEASGTVTPAENADEVVAALLGIEASLDSQQNANGETDAEN